MSTVASPSAFGAELDRRLALLERLSTVPLSEWRFDADEAATLVGALGHPREIPPEIHAELRDAAARLRETQASWAKELKRLLAWSRVQVWVGLLLSAIFTAAYFIDHRLPDLFCAVVWAANMIIQARRCHQEQ